MIKKILIITLLFYTCFILHSQTLTKEFLRSVQEADQYYYFNEDFELAASLYKPLYEKYPDNCNLASKLGICYLSIDGKRSEALRLLKIASRNIVISDDQYLEYGDKAPLETHFYLAYAYHLNDSLDKAIELYSAVKKTYNPTQAFRVDYIDNQIKACRYAIEQQKSAVSVSANLFTSWLKDYQGACSPVISDNDSVFIFTVKKGNNTSIFCSYKDDSWGEPDNITQQLGNYENMFSNSITGNGKMLVLYMEEKGEGNLFFSVREGKVWSKIKKFGKEINTKYWESHGYITPDGNKLFIASNRPGGVGELDIYVSERDTKGNWGPVTNAGRTINTSYNENTPFFDQKNNTLLYSSVGLQGMGDYDLFSSTYKNARWSKPIGLPYPLNNTSENLFFLPNLDGSDYVTSIVDNKAGVRNIYRLAVSTDFSASSIVAGGSVYLQDGMIINPAITEVMIAKSDSIAVWQKVEVNDSGAFSFIAKPGDYQLQVSYEGYKTDTIDLAIPKTFTGKTIDLNTSLIPEKVISGDFISIKNILFDYNSYALGANAITELEKIKSVLLSLTNFTIEISGYTDSKGSIESNKRLAEQRAQAVIDYLSAGGINEVHFVKKAIGAADYVAVNTNTDGTDNPEGRKYNRRVTIGMIDPTSGITIQQESYTPSHLRNPSSLKYSIVLLRSNEKYYPDYFRNLSLDELLFVRPIIQDSLYLYILGEFGEKSDAISYLKYSVENGFPDAYIVNQYDLNNDSPLSVNRYSGREQVFISKVYTIQLQAFKKPLADKKFNGLTDVMELYGADGFYRYVYGEFDGFSKAKDAIENVYSAGYKDAFIREYNILIDQASRP
jgi:outer membrane protein OmpA-like peptidoglycan-associated protein